MLNVCSSSVGVGSSASGLEKPLTNYEENGEVYKYINSIEIGADYPVASLTCSLIACLTEFLLCYFYCSGLKRSN